MKVHRDANRLLLTYTPERANPHWVTDRFDKGEAVLLRRTFSFQAHHLYCPEHRETQDILDDEDTFAFVLGQLSGDYFKIDREIVSTKNSFYFHKDTEFSTDLFVAERNIAILPRIDKLVSEDVYIGGTRDGAMPEIAYRELLARFPNSYELDRYAAARVGACLVDYFETATDTERLYRKYMNKRLGSRRSTIVDTFRRSELAKYRTLLEKLRAMLASESSYCESNWQDEILGIIRLLHPKYIHAFKNVPIRDPNGRRRCIDILLVDSCGSIDIIEIKQPFDNCIVSKRQYRSNYIPVRELSGTIMQLEKYIFYLSKWGKAGEDRLSERYRNKLPKGLKIRIVNPRGIIIMGRSDEKRLPPCQQEDFEIIKRKYKSVIDIITYDDLLARLGFTVSQLQTGLSVDMGASDASG